MKKIPVVMVSGYVFISVLLAVCYMKVEGTGETEIPVVSEGVLLPVESPEEDKQAVLGTDVGMPEKNTVSKTEDKSELELFSVVTKTPENMDVGRITEVPAVMTPTTVPAVTIVPTATMVPTMTPTAVPTATKVPTPTLAALPEMRDKSEIKFSYTNTEYRMSKETQEQLTDLIFETSYTNSFVIYDITTGAGISYNEKTYFPVASTVKAPFAMTCLWQIEEGKYSLADTMEYLEEHKVSGSGEIWKEEFGKMYTIKELIEKSVLISDDIGYLMLQEYFGYKEYNNFLKNLGNKVTIGNGVKWGKTSTIDSMRNWMQIYDYINSGEENSAFFAELLKNTNKSFIRNVLGDEYLVLNKMGWVYNQCCHDHAIIMDEQPYLMMIMTMGDVGAKNQKFIEDLAILLNEIHEEMIHFGAIQSLSLN